MATRVKLFAIGPRNQRRDPIPEVTSLYVSLEEAMESRRGFGDLFGDGAVFPVRATFGKSPRCLLVLVDKPDDFYPKHPLDLPAEVNTSYETAGNIYSELGSREEVLRQAAEYNHKATLGEEREDDDEPWAVCCEVSEPMPYRSLVTIELLDGKGSLEAVPGFGLRVVQPTMEEIKGILGE